METVAHGCESIVMNPGGPLGFGVGRGCFGGAPEPAAAPRRAASCGMDVCTAVLGVASCGGVGGGAAATDGATAADGAGPVADGDDDGVAADGAAAKGA